MLPLFTRRDKRNVDYALTRARTFSVQPMKTKEPIAAKRKLNDNPIRPRSENMQSVPSAGKRVKANSTLALILLLIGREKSIMMLGCVWVKTESDARCFSSVSGCGCGFGFEKHIDGSTILAKIRQGSADLHTPIHPPPPTPANHPLGVQLNLHSIIVTG